MSRLFAFNFQKWIDENKIFLNPSICNKKVFKQFNMMVNVVGGLNKRNDYHYDPFNKIFKLKGDMIL